LVSLDLPRNTKLPYGHKDIIQAGADHILAGWPGGQNMVYTGLNYVPAATTSKAGHIMTDNMFVLKENIFA